jgi:hypothetical protein
MKKILTRSLPAFGSARGDQGHEAHKGGDKKLLVLIQDLKPFFAASCEKCLKLLSVFICVHPWLTAYNSWFSLCALRLCARNVRGFYPENSKWDADERRFSQIVNKH